MADPHKLHLGRDKLHQSMKKPAAKRRSDQTIRKPEISVVAEYDQLILFADFDVDL